MKISVVTISFNQATFLPECIASVAAQKGPFEHIIVDPGSTDGSREIIASEHTRFSHIVLELDEGPADGLNRGFACASGEVFYYLNADDVVLPGAFAEARAILELLSDVDVVSGGGYAIDENGKFGRRLWSDPVSRPGLAHGGSIQIQPSTFIRRAAFERAGGFNRDNRSSWDGELVIDMFETGARFHQVDRSWSGFRIHDDSITGSGILADCQRAYRRRMHKRLTGREYGWGTRLMAQLFRIRRILRHPSILIYRLIHGRLYGSRRK